MSAPSKLKETIYVGRSEIQRVFQGDGLTTRTEIKTSHVTESPDSVSPLLSIETSGVSAGSAPKELFRYRISTNLELDDSGRVLSGSAIEAPKTYRYASYRRDSETSLYFCQARYYAPWIGRWTSPDPKDTVDGTNVYCYVANDPINYTDPEGTMKVGLAPNNANPGTGTIAIPMPPTNHSGGNQPLGIGTRLGIGARRFGSAFKADVVKNVHPKRLIASAVLSLGTVGLSYWQTPDDVSTGAKFGIATGMGMLGGVVGYALSVTWDSVKEGREGFRSSDARTTEQIAKDKDAGQTKQITSLEGEKKPLTEANETLVQTNKGLQDDKTTLEKAKTDLETSKNETIAQLQAEMETLKNRLTKKEAEACDLTTQLSEQKASHAETFNEKMQVINRFKSHLTSKMKLKNLGVPKGLFK